MSERRTTVKRARAAQRAGHATPKGGRTGRDAGKSPQQTAFERAQRAVKVSRRRAAGDEEPQGFPGRKARRAAGKRQRLARARQHRLAKR